MALVQLVGSENDALSALKNPRVVKLPSHRLHHYLKKSAPGQQPKAEAKQKNRLILPRAFPMPALHTGERPRCMSRRSVVRKPGRLRNHAPPPFPKSLHTTLEPQEADAIVVNTCAFLTSATEESVQRILEPQRIQRDRTLFHIVAAGCLSQRYREDLLKELPELDALLVLGFQ